MDNIGEATEPVKKGFFSRVGSAAASVAGKVGSAGMWSLDKIGTGAIWTADKVGGGMFAAAGPAASAAGFAAKTGQVMAGHSGNFLSAFVNNSVDFVAKDPASTERLTMANGKFKLSGMGKGLLVVGAAVKMARDSVEALEKSRMGTMTGEMMTATPQPQSLLNKEPSYSDDGGATGDLVFALNKLRKG